MTSYIRPRGSNVDCVTAGKSTFDRTSNDRPECDTYERDWSTLPLPAMKSRPIQRGDAESLIIRLVNVAHGHGGLFVVSSVGDEEPCAPYPIEDKKSGGL